MAEKDEGYTFKVQKHTLWKFSTFVLLILFVISLLTGGFGIGSDDSDSQIIPQQPGPQAPPTNIQLDLDDDGSVKGDADAEVTIIEFSDFECPFCGRFYTDTLPQLVKEYIDTGKVKLIYKDFPLPFHPSAAKAAIASECAEEQGKFWEMHDKLFETQTSWGNQGLTVSVPLFKQYAKDMGLDAKQFDSCLDSDKYATEVQEDTAEGGSYVSGTPSFFIGNEDGYTLLVGAQPFAAFQQVIEDKL